MKKSFLNEADYLRVFQSVMKWPNWKKELVNERLLVGKHAKKIPMFKDLDLLEMNKNAKKEMQI